MPSLTRLACRAVVLVLCLVGAFSSAVYAADVSGSASVVSDYLFRGLSQTNRDPALQAGIEIDGAQGLYAGVWGSNISWLSDGSTSTAPISSSLETDGYIGWRTTFANKASFDVGLYTYYYPGTYPSGFTSPDTTEGYVGVGYAGFHLKYSHAFTNLFGFADSKHSDYWDLSWSHDLAARWSLSAHVGHQRVKHVASGDYTDWNLVLLRSFAHGYSVSLGYYDTNADRGVYTNAHNHYLGRATAVLALSKSF
ncbi:TorF family putative porin [Oleiagrimonas sp. C23AA]|uniref:TorF family putative porin n=1 Tax=Oleiagrimonas sp. C23AA TaxID=2719047 RepID=UPI00141F2EC1|nr:TorF family putative porin [Oleiagrimonas sp. C23AA]NII10621.1 hypothetical protein [Oleiagrimonas sp. C23AA]